MKESHGRVMKIEVEPWLCNVESSRMKLTHGRVM